MRRLPGLLWLLLLSCAPPLALEGAPCPCAADWVCCPTALVCVREPSACPVAPGPGVSPATITLGAGRKQRFTSSSPDTTWSIEEGAAGGTIDEAGRYRAPDVPGEYHLLARAGGGLTRVTVTVRPLRLSVLAGNYGGTSAKPIDGVGPRARFSEPKSLVREGEWLYFVDQRTLRRFHRESRAVETILRPGFQFGPTGWDRITRIEAVGPSVTGKLVILDGSCVREVRVADLSVDTIGCTASADVTFGLGLAGDEAAVYSSGPGLVRWDRRTRTTSQLPTVAPFGSATLLRRRGNDLYAVHQNAGTVSKLDLTSGTSSVVVAPLGRRFIGLVLTQGETGPRLLAADAAGAVTVIDESGQRSDFTIPEGAVGFEADETGDHFPHSFVLTRAALLIERNHGLELLAGRPAGPLFSVDGTGAAAALFPRRGISASGSVVWVNEGNRFRLIERDGTTTTFPTPPDTGIGSFASHGNVLAGIVYASTQLVVFRDGAWHVTPFSAWGPGPRVAGFLDSERVVIVDQRSATVVKLSGEVLREVRLPSQAVGAGALDPSGGLVFSITLAGEALNGVFRFDLESGEVTRLTAPFESGAPTPQVAAVDLPHVYGRTPIGRGFGQTGPGYGSTVGAASSTSPWRTLVGDADLPMVEPGPLPGRIQTAAGLAVLDNGDLVIADDIENVVLVVE